MIGFRTKGRGKERVVYPISEGGKTYRRHYTEKPSLSSKCNIHSDVKKMMQKDDSIEHGSKDYDAYKKRLEHHADAEYLKQLQKAEKRREKEIRKEEKELKKQQEKENQEQQHREDIQINDNKT